VVIRVNPVSQKLAHSLAQLKQLQDQGVVALQSKMLERTDRERLVKHGFICEVMRGWYIPSSPDEQSIQLHIGDKTVPPQLLVRSPRGRNKPTPFIHNTSVFDLRLALPVKNQLTKIDGFRVYGLAAAIVHCSKNNFVEKPIQMRTALSTVADASEVLSVLLDGGHATIAGRIAGAFRNIDRNLIADNIVKGMAAADYKVKEIDPFEDKTHISFGRRDVSPYVNRMRLMWHVMREDIIKHFPEAPVSPVNISQYLDEVEDKFVTDAYHSLSIEGYRVTHELIEYVRSGQWNPEQSDESKKHLDVMALYILENRCIRHQAERLFEI